MTGFSMSANLLRETIAAQLLFKYLARHFYLQVRVLSEPVNWGRVKVIPFLGDEAFECVNSVA